MIEVAAGLVFCSGFLLITQRNASDHLGGYWEFPGGKRHEGETYEQCLQRELREELGIEVQVVDRLTAINYAYPEKEVHLEFFRCLWQSGIPKAIECQDFAWIKAADLPSYSFPPADAQLLHMLCHKDGIWLNLNSPRATTDLRFNT